MAAQQPSSTGMHATELRATYDKGLGVFSSTPLDRGHVAVSIEKHLVVCEGHMFGWSATFAKLGGILEDCKAPMELKLAVFLICERNGLDQRSSITDYVNSLPGTPVDSLSGIPPNLGDELSWGKEETEWAAAIAAANLALIARADAAEAILQTPAETAQHFPKEVFSTEALRFGLGNVYSRAFCLGGAIIMLPIIDLINHAKRGSMRLNCEVAFDGAGGVVVRTTRALGAGEELCICYEDMSVADQFCTCGIPNPAMP